jgi:PPOX class probable F420-dependent enzyme
MSSAPSLEEFLGQPRNVIVAGVRKDGRPHLSPNWFYWDGENFYVSTTRKRAKYHIFRRDPRAELVVDDPSDLRYVEIAATASIREDVRANLALFRAIREKHGRPVPSDDELAASLIADDRILLVFTPSAPRSAWTAIGLS